MTAERSEVVVVDDDEGDLELAKVAFMECSEPIDVSTFENGQAALDYLAATAGSGRRRVVLLDLNMPGLDGRQTLERIKSAPALASTVVIVFTTSDSRVDVESCYAGCANAFITKPSELSQYRTIARRIEDFWFGTALLPD